MTSPRPLRIGIDIAAYVVLPILGILFWGWDWRPVVVLYWLDNVTTGVLTLISLVRRRRAGEATGMHPLFFLVHYGIFTTVHGVFVFLIVMMLPGLSFTGGPIRDAEPLPLLPIVIGWGVAALIQWGLAIFSEKPFTDGIGSAYARIVVLHLAILLGVFLIIALQLPAMVAILLVVLRSAAEWALAGLRRVSEEFAAGLRPTAWKFEQTGPAQWHVRRVVRTTVSDGSGVRTTEQVLQDGPAGAPADPRPAPPEQQGGSGF